MRGFLVSGIMLVSRVAPRSSRASDPKARPLAKTGGKRLARPHGRTEDQRAASATSVERANLPRDRYAQRPAGGRVVDFDLEVFAGIRDVDAVRLLAADHGDSAAADL